jgi:hypothetical protein
MSIEKTTTRVLVRAEFLIDVKHPRSLTRDDVNDYASEYVRGYVNPYLKAATTDIYGEYVEVDIDLEPDFEVGIMERSRTTSKTNFR